MDNCRGDPKFTPARGGRPPSTIIIGLGNPILGDDGFGWAAARQFEAQYPDLDGVVQLEYASLGGLSLMERLVGYDIAILIDALHLGKAPHGTLYSLSLDDLPDYSIGHTTSTHDTTLRTAILLGRSLGAQLPHVIWIVGVETELVYDFTETLSPPVAGSIQSAVLLTRQVLDRLFAQPLCITIGQPPDLHHRSLPSPPRNEADKL